MLIKILADFFSKKNDEEKAMIVIAFLVIVVAMGLVITPLTFM